MQGPMSIGVDGERGGGTLGGFVEVGVAGAKHRGFLANWHVVQPPRNADVAAAKGSAAHGTLLCPLGGVRPKKTG